MKWFAILTFCFNCLLINAMNKTTIYCFPGQGADRRIFQNVSVDTNHYEIVFIEYGIPAPGITMKDFAHELSVNIDTTKDFILLGVSLGGMICAELSELLKPQKTILISSAKNRNELPWRYKFQKTIPIYKIVPSKILLAGAKILQPIVESDRNKYKKIFKSMLAGKDKTYMKRTIGMIVNWERNNNTKKLIHIHGDNDHTLPIRKIEKPDYVIKNGSHMMTLTRADELNIILNCILAR